MVNGSIRSYADMAHRAGDAAVIDWDDGSDTAKLIVHKGFYITYYGSGTVTSEVHGKVKVTSP